MKYWYDTEFMDDGTTIDLISIGIIAEDGRELYMENADCDLTKANDWVKANVLTKLTGLVQPKHIIASKVKEFLSVELQNELWGYYSAYDHIALCQLFGPMSELPVSIPMFTNDIKQLMVKLVVSDIELPNNDNTHNALDDAKWTLDAYIYLDRLQDDHYYIGR